MAKNERDPKININGLKHPYAILDEVHEKAKYIMQSEFTENSKKRKYKQLYKELYNLVLEIYRMT